MKDVCSGHSLFQINLNLCQEFLGPWRSTGFSSALPLGKWMKAPLCLGSPWSSMALPCRVLSRHVWIYTGLGTLSRQPPDTAPLRAGEPSWDWMDLFCICMSVETGLIIALGLWLFRPAPWSSSWGQPWLSGPHGQLLSWLYCWVMNGYFRMLQFPAFMSLSKCLLPHILLSCQER